MPRKRIYLIKNEEQDCYIDLAGRVQTDPKYKYPAAFPTTDKALFFIKNQLEGSTEEKKKKFTLVKFSPEEYFSTFFQNSFINNFNDLQALR